MVRVVFVDFTRSTNSSDYLQYMPTVQANGVRHSRCRYGFYFVGGQGAKCEISAVSAAFFPSPPVGEGGSNERSSFETGEGSVSAERPPHPARISSAPPSPTRG